MILLMHSSSSPSFSPPRMSDAGDEIPVEAGAQEETTVATEAIPKGKMSLEEALQQVLKISLQHDGLARGLRECAKALDKRQAHLCVLVETNTEAEYLKLIEALCADHKINLIKASPSSPFFLSPSLTPIFPSRSRMPSSSALGPDFARLTKTGTHAKSSGVLASSSRTTAPIRRECTSFWIISGTRLE